MHKLMVEQNTELFFGNVMVLMLKVFGRCWGHPDDCWVFRSANEGRDLGNEAGAACRWSSDVSLKLSELGLAQQPT